MKSNEPGGSSEPALSTTRDITNPPQRNASRSQGYPSTVLLLGLSIIVNNNWVLGT